VYRYGFTDLQIVGVLFYGFTHHTHFWCKKETGDGRRRTPGEEEFRKTTTKALIGGKIFPKIFGNFLFL
jgi:hypothetical protein